MNRMNYTRIKNVSLMYYEQKRRALRKPSEGEKYRYIRPDVLQVLNGYNAEKAYILHMYSESRADALQTKRMNSEHIVEGWMM